MTSLICCVASFLCSESPVPSNLYLEIGAPPAYQLTIYPDGGGFLTFGVAVPFNNQFPAGTFDFRRIWDNLHQSTTAQGSTVSHYSVRFCRSEDRVRFSVYTLDGYFVDNLFRTAYRLLEKPSGLDQVWQTQPLRMLDATKGYESFAETPVGSRPPSPVPSLPRETE